MRKAFSWKIISNRPSNSFFKDILTHENLQIAFKRRKTLPSRDFNHQMSRKKQFRCKNLIMKIVVVFLTFLTT